MTIASSSPTFRVSVCLSSRLSANTSKRHINAIREGAEEVAYASFFSVLPSGETIVMSLKRGTKTLPRRRHARGARNVYAENFVLNRTKLLLDNQLNIY